MKKVLYFMGCVVASVSGVAVLSAYITRWICHIAGTCASNTTQAVNDVSVLMTGLTLIVWIGVTLFGVLEGSSHE
jgi:hypothetical protein